MPRNDLKRRPQSPLDPNLAVPLVSTYIDDVPLFVNFNLTDIERVEVLRGPQGTLYGSGAVGGTVKLIRHKPELGVLSADVTADLSGTDHSSGASYSFDGIINVPLGETVALRANAGYTKSRLTLHDVLWTNDLRVSGSVMSPGRSGNGVADVVVTGPDGMSGELKIRWTEGIVRARAQVRGAF
jgi:outer membrane receptor protein involved in Fe transport